MTGYEHATFGSAIFTPTPKNCINAFDVKKAQSQ